MDPVTISLASVGSTVITEGVKFLYSQAGEILKRWREHPADQLQSAEPLGLAHLPPAFDGQLIDPKINFEAVAAREQSLRAAYRDLSEFGTGLLVVDPTNTEILNKIETLRSCLELILGQHLTFSGENRLRSGTALVGTVNAETIEGEASGVEGTGQVDQAVTGAVNVRTVKSGGKVSGVKWTH
jgi:hypothetical protein